MGIVLDREVRNGVVEVRKVNSQLMFAKVIGTDQVEHQAPSYGPQVTKRGFWEEFDSLLLCVNKTGKATIDKRRDLNGHVGKDNHGYDEVLEGWGLEKGSQGG